MRVNVWGKLCLGGGLLFSLYGYARPAIDFPDGQNCVAWKAKKTMFLFRKSEPVGLNCKIRIRVESPAPSHYQVTVNIPLGEFSSGEAERDLEVRKLLREDKQADLLFISDTLTGRDWPSYLEGSLPLVKGALKVGGQNYPVTLQLQKRTGPAPLYGKIEVSLKSLEVAAPAVAGGLVAQVDDIVELWMQVYPESFPP